MTQMPGTSAPEGPHSDVAPEPLAQRHRSFSQRLVAALKLDSDLYEEVEHDPTALGHAAGVVALAAVASAIGALGIAGPGALLGGLLGTFVSWAVWTAIVWLVGVKIFGHTSDFEELLRTLGFVAAPQLLYVFALVPVAFLQALVALAVLAMTLVAFVRATRQALDVETGRALVVAGLGLLVYVLLGAAFGTIARIG